MSTDLREQRDEARREAAAWKATSAGVEWERDALRGALTVARVQVAELEAELETARDMCARPRGVCMKAKP